VAKTPANCPFSPLLHQNINSEPEFYTFAGTPGFSRMIVYQVNVTIDPSVNDEWLAWMKSVHIPDVMATGCFSEYRFSRVVEGAEAGGNAYSVQYVCGSMADYARYRDRFAAALQAAHRDKYAGKFKARRTLSETL
jgi:hypothetical protein